MHKSDLTSTTEKATATKQLWQQPQLRAIGAIAELTKQCGKPKDGNEVGGLPSEDIFCFPSV